jgi:hypothetical protein
VSQVQELGRIPVEDIEKVKASADPSESEVEVLGEAKVDLVHPGRVHRARFYQRY